MRQGACCQRLERQVLSIFVSCVISSPPCVVRCLPQLIIDNRVDLELVYATLVQRWMAVVLSVMDKDTCLVILSGFSDQLGMAVLL